MTLRRVTAVGNQLQRHLLHVGIALDIDHYDFAVKIDFEDGRPPARIEQPAVTTPKSPT